MRIHDQALPADRRARLLKINPHHDHDAVRDFLRRAAASWCGVHAARFQIVNRTRSYDQQKPFVVREDQPVNFTARAGHKFSLRIRFGQLRQQSGRGWQGTRLDDIDVRSFLHEAPAWAARVASRKPQVVIGG